MRKLLLLVLVFISGMSYAIAQSAVTGTVTDENGEGIPGANIVIKGTSQGTITDIDGALLFKFLLDLKLTSVYL